jgi:NTP pyrophosphatase (non-canonical NTP hydrolase)
MGSFKPTESSDLLTKLGYLVEEAGEVLAAAGKTLRWGTHNYNPLLPVSERELNKDWLLRELTDLEYASNLVRKQLEDLQ